MLNCIMKRMILFIFIIMLPLEIAQRGVHMVMSKKNFRYQPANLFKDIPDLTVRQLFAHQTVTKKYSAVTYDPSLHTNMVLPYAAEAASLVCYKGSITDFKELSLKESPQFVNSVYFPKDCKLNIVCHGYSTNITQNILNIVSSLIKKFGADGCHCALNWEKEAAAYIGSITKPIEDILGLEVIGIDYPAVSVIAGLVVAKDLTDALQGMKSRGFNISSLYLIGHSEGAHIAGNVGKNLKKSGITISRITGLDPAKPAIENHLKKGDADLVDCVHTNPNFLGTNKALCDIDFWVNYGCKVQPGCQKNAVPLTPSSLCSHKRALKYMAEAILSPSYQGRKAASYEEFSQSTGTPDPDNVNIIGSDIKPSVTGNFYLCTNAEPEYGRGPAGMNPSNCTCPTT